MPNYTAPWRADFVKRRPNPRRPKYSRGFYALLPPVPREPTTENARAYFQAVIRAMDRGGWTHGESAGLRRLARRWLKRLNGEDPRWGVVASRAGRLPRELERALK